MSHPDGDWHGLWHGAARPRSHWLSQGLVIYVVVPLVIALMQLSGDGGLLRGLADVYPKVFVVNACIGGLFELQYGLLWPRLLHRKPSWPIRIALHGVSVVVAVVVGGTVAAAVYVVAWGDRLTAVALAIWRAGSGLAAILIAVLVVLDEVMARSRAFERQAAQARVAALRAELAAIQARTDPHFLFNSLNTVAASIPDDPALAERLLERLAAVFRYALDAGRRATVAVDDEIAAVTAYLDIEASRLGERLRWRVDRDGEVAAARLPPLLLQPLAENAIRHGVAARRGGSQVVVSVRREQDRLVLAVEDQPLDPARVEVIRSTSGAGTALADLAARLALAYGDRGRLTAGPVPPAGWRAEVVVPADGRLLAEPAP